MLDPKHELQKAYKSVVEDLSNRIEAIANAEQANEFTKYVARGELFGKPKELCIDAAPVLHSRLTQTAFVGNNAVIRKSTDLTLPTAIKMMIYAQAGTGKTTLSLSAPKPLLLDFDGGVNRINLSHLEGVDIVQVTNWEEIKQLLASPLRQVFLPSLRSVGSNVRMRF